MEPRAPQLSASPEEQYDAAALTVSLGNTPAAAARKAPPVVALSEDSTLLDAMSAAALDHAAVIVSPSADRFVDQLVATGAELALIDAAASPPGLAEFLVSLHQQFPQLQLLLVGPGNVQHQVAEQIADGTVFRFVHKPASAARLKLFVEAALRQRQARITDEILSTPFSSPHRAAGPQSPSGRPRWITNALLAGLLIAAAGTLLWHFASSNRPAQTPMPSSFPVSPPAPAEAGVTQNASAETLLAQQKEAEQEAIDRAAAQRAENDRIASAEQSRADASLDQARRAAAAVAQARTEQVHTYVQLALSRIASGALIEPDDDSARTYVTSAARLAPDDASVRTVAASLSEALTASFNKALAAGDRAAAEHWLKASRSYPVGEAAVDQMSLQLGGFEVAQAAQVTADQAVANAERSAAQTPVAPQPDVAPASVAASLPATAPVAAPIARIVPESSLHRLSFAVPAYPQGALAHGQTGTVDLDFTVTPKGSVVDVKVTASNPAGIFEEAAIAALLRDRYQPVQRDGVAVPQRAHIRMRFAL